MKNRKRGGIGVSEPSQQLQKKLGRKAALRWRSLRSSLRGSG